VDNTYSKVASLIFTPITAADLLNDQVLPFFADEAVGILRILTDRGTEYCAKLEQHDYQLYLAMNDIEHTRAKAAPKPTDLRVPPQDHPVE